MIAPMGSPWTAPTTFTSRAQRFRLIFPPPPAPSSPSLNGASNAFVTKLNPAGSSLVYSTYLGGSGIDQGNAIAVTPAGRTASSLRALRNPLTSPRRIRFKQFWDSAHNTYCGSAPCADAFVTQLNAAGNALTYSTYLGGNGPDFGQAIALDSTGDPYITGSTSSTNFPAISPNRPLIPL